MADQSKSYWQQRYEKARVEGTWDHAPPAIPDRPAGSMTRTAKSSRKLAVSYSIMTAAMIFPVAFELATWNFFPAVMLAMYAVMYWRSYRILERFEAQQAAETSPAVPDRADVGDVGP